MQLTARELGGVTNRLLGSGPMSRQSVVLWTGQWMLSSQNRMLLRCKDMQQVSKLQNLKI